MANFTLYSLLLLFSIHHIAAAVATTNPTTTAPDFIRASCKATLYPALCIQSLSTYAATVQQSERGLAQAALSVSLARARSTAAFVSKMTRVSGIKPREYRAVRDCVDNMGDTVDQLSRSIVELGRMGRGGGSQEFSWHVSNVQTWVSAALTNENTCVDGFSGRYMEGNVKAAIKNRVVKVAQVTSNALALVNRFAARHKG